MRILHYALGFYPYRTGGLTAYVMDVMKEQQRQGHQVAMLWPGKMNFIGKRNPTIKASHNNKYLINSYELINPLPVPLLEGIQDVFAYIEKCDKNIFLKFLSNARPEVIHIHTFMGLYKEFLQVAKELHIPVIYTTHDYFPVCPKGNLICNGVNCQNGIEDLSCTYCNQGALPIWKIVLMQSPLYRKIKNSFLIRKMRKQYQIEKQEGGKNNFPINEELPYHLIRDYYKDMLNLIDCTLCNSTNAEEIYQKLGAVSKTKFLSITNSKVKDKRKIKQYEANQKLRLTYLGGATEAKGYFFLRDVLDQLVSEGENDFLLNVYVSVADGRSYLQIHEPYVNEKEMDIVYNNTDILIVPSLWKETFGFVVLEALSHGTPVIVTENVGAKNLIRSGENGYCVNDNKEDLLEIIKKILNNRQLLIQMNNNICRGAFNFSMNEHVQRLQEIYESINYHSDI